MNWFLQFISFLEKFAPQKPMPPPPSPIVPQQPPAPETLSFDTPAHAWHAVRVLCDNAGLTYDAKNVICACIYQESRFNNKAVNHNINSQTRIITSSDFGICQINDRFHIGLGKDFPSVTYVLANPDKAVQWMISMYRTGKLNLWVSYSSGAYERWLSPSSPMWALKDV